MNPLDLWDDVDVDVEPRAWCTPPCRTGSDCYCGRAAHLAEAIAAGEVDVPVLEATGEAVPVGFYAPDERHHLLTAGIYYRLVSTGRTIEALPPQE